MGKFSILCRAATKTLACKVEGNMTVQDAVNFINLYKQTLATISPPQYSILFDCTELGVSTKESLDKLAECFQLYKHALFKEIYFHTGNNPDLMMQLTRLAQAVKLDNFKVD